jgi:hypothetical protein
MTDRQAVREILKAKRELEAAWDSLPKGWTKDSVKKFWDSMTGEVKKKTTKCMKEMDGKVDDTGAFCGSLADYVTGDTSWRGKD